MADRVVVHRRVVREPAVVERSTIVTPTRPAVIEKRTTTTTTTEPARVKVKEVDTDDDDD
jgi:hypothetical protein